MVQIRKTELSSVSLVLGIFPCRGCSFQRLHRGLAKSLAPLTGALGVMRPGEKKEFVNTGEVGLIREARLQCPGGRRSRSDLIRHREC